MPVIHRIKYDADHPDELVWKHPCDAVPAGSQVVVNQSQEAVLFRDGRALRVLKPGTHTVSSRNIPVLSRLIGRPFGGDSPFPVEVWYVSRTTRPNLKWGTRTPVQVIDPRFSIPLTLRAHGLWGFRVTDSIRFLTALVGTLHYTSGALVHECFTAELLQHVSSSITAMVSQGVSFFGINSRLDSLVSTVRQSLAGSLDAYGVELAAFTIENISVPDNEMETIRSVMTRVMETEQMKDITVSDGYRVVKTFQVLETGAENEGTASDMFTAGLGVSLGLGAGSRMGAALGAGIQGNDTGAAGVVENLQALAKLKNEGLITQAEYNARKTAILERYGL